MDLLDLTWLQLLQTPNMSRSCLDLELPELSDNLANWYAEYSDIFKKILEHFIKQNEQFAKDNNYTH